MHLLHVRPDLSSPDLPNEAGSDAQSRRHHTGGLGARPDLPNSVVGQLRRWSVDAARHAVTSTTLRIPVSHVVRVGAEEQVIRLHAGSDVAMVADAQPFGDRAEVQFPRDAVNEQALGTPNGDPRVPRPVQPPGPQPVVAGLVDTLPEPLGQRTGTSHSRTVTSPPQLAILL